MQTNIWKGKKSWKEGMWDQRHGLDATLRRCLISTQQVTTLKQETMASDLLLGRIAKDRAKGHTRKRGGGINELDISNERPE